MLNMSDGMTRVLLNHVAEHQHTTLENADPARLYDEFNATMYGHIAVGKADMFVDGPAAHVFHDFDAYAKELGELHERFKADNQKETKFSLKTPVEETDKLLALHNKDENSILAAIKLGGLPMPSIAIVKARDGHTKYGPISLVFSKDTIDPQLFRANKVYGGDAWTPTAPRVDYPVNSKKASQVEHELHRLAGDVSVAGGIFGNSAALRSMGIDDTSTRSTAELAEKLASTDTVRAAYLADKGKSLEPVKMDKVWDKFGNDTLQKVVDRLGVNTLAEIEANLETGESVKDALGENAEVIRDILRDYYREQGEPCSAEWPSRGIGPTRRSTKDGRPASTIPWTAFPSSPWRTSFTTHGICTRTAARPRAKLTGWLPLTRCAAPWMTTPLRSGLPGSWTACWARQASTMARTPTPPPAISAASHSSTMPTPWRTSSRR